jgi:uncharacterized protein (DUF427 family)
VTLGKFSQRAGVVLSMKATFNGITIAETDDTVIVEGNHYFPIAAIRPGVLADSEHSTVCPWKGTAAYYDIVVDGATAANGAWYYPQPSEAAAAITDRVAFQHVVSVTF